MTPALFRLLTNCYPPYWGTGISVKRISPDYRRLTIQMKSRFYNRNYVGTHFGGSLYAMTDPFYMLMLIQILGPGYLVWDKSARIDFIRPGRGTVTAEFRIDQAQIDTILSQTASGRKYLPELPVEVKDQYGELVARVIKTLYIRKKEPRQE
jgi:acyl-coenzyme A thioesterase PaaI-like protein